MPANPCCCGSCAICSDTFDRSDSTDIDTGSTCGWTETAGGWEIVSNTLQVTSSKTNAIALCDSQTHASSAAAKVTVDLRSTSNNDLLRVIVNYVDSSNYHFVEFKFGVASSIFTPAFTLYQRVAGTNTAIGTTGVMATSASTTYTMTVCFASGVFSATVGSVTASHGVATPSAARSVGLGTGATAAGTISFDNFSVVHGRSSVNPTCDFCGFTPTCACCSSGTTSGEYVIDLGAATLTDASCNACDTIAGEYTAVWDGGTVCRWTYLDTALCGGCAFTGGNGRLRFTLEMLTDTGEDPDQCFWRLKIVLNWAGDDTYGGQCDGQAQYESDPEAASIDCNGPWTLQKVGGQGTYRGNSGWQATDETWGTSCTGTLPETITLSLP